MTINEVLNEMAVRLRNKATNVDTCLGDPIKLEAAYARKDVYEELASMVEEIIDLGYTGMKG